MALEFQEIKFILNVKVKYTDAGDVHEDQLGVDLVNRKVYKNGEEVSPDMHEAFFAHLDKATRLPEDMYAAPPDLSEKAAQMQQEHDYKNYTMG